MPSNKNSLSDSLSLSLSLDQSLSVSRVCLTESCEVLVAVLESARGVAVEALSVARVGGDEELLLVEPDRDPLLGLPDRRLPQGTLGVI